MDPDVDTSNLPEHPTPGQILHIYSADAQCLTVSLMNDFCCEIVQVCKNLEFRTFTPSGNPSPPKICRTATKNDASAESTGKTAYPLEKTAHPHQTSSCSPIRHLVPLQMPNTKLTFWSIR